MNKGRPREFDEIATLERVMHSFWRRGYKETTFRQLVADSGLSRSSLYTAFGGKDEIFEQALSLYVEQEHAEFFRQLRDEESGAEFLRSLVQSFREPYHSRSKGCLLQKTILENAASGGQPKQSRTVTNSLLKMWSSFKSAVRNLRPKKVKPISNEERAGLLVAIIFGVAVLARNGRNQKIMDAITDGTAKLIEGKQ